MSKIGRTSSWLGAHARGAFRHARAPVPWPHMFECGAAAAVPTVLGLAAGEVNLAIYGGLMGYLMALNDHFGALSHRVLVSSLSFAGLSAAFLLGVHLQASPHDFFLVLSLLTYWLGLMTGRGAEVERLLLFALLEMVCVRYFPKSSAATTRSVLPYAAAAWGTLLTCQLVSARLARRHIVTEYARLRSSVRNSLTRQSERHRFAITLTFATIWSAYLVERYAIERGYWMIITVLLVTRPDVREGLYRPMQRLVGTLGGVLCGDLTILTVGTKAALVLGVFLSAFGVPLALKRNYWLVSFFATILVLMFLTLTSEKPGVHLPFVRLLATAYGCGLSGVVTLTSAALVRCFRWYKLK